MGIRASKIQPEGKPRFWYRDNFFLTTDKTYLEPELVNQAFASDLMWWNQPIEPTQMKKMLDNCFTVCVFSVAETEEQMKSKPLSFLCCVGNGLADSLCRERPSQATSSRERLQVRWPSTPRH